jgi:putative DNA primase/helicase
MSRPPLPVDPYELTERIKDNFPTQLLELRRWVLWGWNEAKQEKIILDRINKPEAWENFDNASTLLINGPGACGFMFAIGDGVTCVDLDEVLHDGVAEEWAQRIVENISSYTEVSPSGTGLHIICKVSNPDLQSIRRNNIEFYTNKRWLCVTGDLYESRNILYETDGAMYRLYASLKKRKPILKSLPLAKNEIPASDKELLEKMFSSKNGKKIRVVWEGGGNYGSPSEGDMALMSYLGYWTGCNSSRMKNLFLQSQRGAREKAKRNDYLEWTISKIIGGR